MKADTFMEGRLEVYSSIIKKMHCWTQWLLVIVIRWQEYLHNDGLWHYRTPSWHVQVDRECCACSSYPLLCFEAMFAERAVTSNLYRWLPITLTFSRTWLAIIAHESSKNGVIRCWRSRLHFECVSLVKSHFYILHIGMNMRNTYPEAPLSTLPVSD